MDTVGRRRRFEGALLFICFAGCVPLANWLLGNVGTVCVPQGPCLVPVAPGLLAPSGVLAVGAGFVLRDLVQRRLGLSWSFVAIVAGTVLSAAFAPPELVVASVIAFALSELCDLLVFTPLQQRGLLLAATVSSLAGLVVDSICFLLLAFGSLDFLAGQIVGKLWMVLAAMPILIWIRGRERRLGIEIA